MKVVSLSFCVFVLSFSYSHGLNVDQNSDRIEPFHNEVVNTTITDMNNDILYMILIQMELHDLLNVAVSSPRLSSISAEVYRRKYSNKMLYLKVDSNLGVKNAQFYMDNNRIEIYGLRTCLDLLKHFGIHLQKIRIEDYPITQSDLKAVSRFVNEYGSESLKELELVFHHNEKDALDQFTVPFYAMEEIYCDFRTEFLNETQPWNQLFPQLKRLFLDLTTIGNIDFLNCEFTHLDTLFLRGEYDNWHKDMEQIYKLIRKNPTIQSLITCLAEPEFIEFISQNMPKLNNITISELHIKTDTVDKLSLPNLEWLSTFYNSNLHDTWLQFFRRHTDIKYLLLTEYPSKSSSQGIELNTLTADLPNLIEVKVKTYNYLGNELIIKFIENHKKLRKFSFQFNLRSTTMTVELTALLEHFKNEWNIKSINTPELKGYAFVKNDFKQLY